MVLTECGKNWKGEKCFVYLDGYLKKNLDVASDYVRHKNWDYVALVSGLPGAGKSNFSISLAKYLDKDFTIKNIAFDDKSFIKITNEAKEFSAVLLDESFSSLNTRISNSSKFLRIINHLQLIRQKHLFIFLNLPNFFDLSKGVAIFRSSHLFVVYAEEGERGRFTAFDRDRKKSLYINGIKYINYNAEKANFHGRFHKQKAISETAYDKLKMEHLKSQDLKVGTSKAETSRDKLIIHLKDNKIMKRKDISEVSGLNERTIYNILKRGKKEEKE